MHARAHVAVPPHSAERMRVVGRTAWWSGTASRRRARPAARGAARSAAAPAAAPGTPGSAAQTRQAPLAGAPRGAARRAGPPAACRRHDQRRCCAACTAGPRAPGRARRGEPRGRAAPARSAGWSMRDVTATPVTAAPCSTSLQTPDGMPRWLHATPRRLPDELLGGPHCALGRGQERAVPARAARCLRCRSWARTCWTCGA